MVLMNDNPQIIGNKDGGLFVAAGIVPHAIEVGLILAAVIAIGVLLIVKSRGRK